MDTIKGIINWFVENWNIIKDIILLIITIIAIFKAIQYAIKSNLIEQVAKYIKDAEGHSELSGEEKMALVVGWMRDFIPRAFKVVFSDEVLKQIAQNIFNDMKKYANKYVHNQTGGNITEAKLAIENSKDDPGFLDAVESVKNS